LCDGFLLFVDVAVVTEIQSSRHSVLDMQLDV